MDRDSLSFIKSFFIHRTSITYVVANSTGMSKCVFYWHLFKLFALLFGAQQVIAAQNDMADKDKKICVNTKDKQLLADPMFEESIIKCATNRAVAVGFANNFKTEGCKLCATQVCHCMNTHCSQSCGVPEMGDTPCGNCFAKSCAQKGLDCFNVGFSQDDSDGGNTCFADASDHGLFLVLGVTGRIGKAVAERLLSKSDKYTIRAAVRSKEKAEAWVNNLPKAQQSRVHIYVVSSYDATEEMMHALALDPKPYGVFAFTPLTLPLGNSEKKYQEKVRAFSANISLALRFARLRKFVYLSFRGVDELMSHGSYAGFPYAAQGFYGEVEVSSLGSQSTVAMFLRSTILVENYCNYKRLPFFAENEAQIVMSSVDDVAESVVTLLTDDKYMEPKWLEQEHFAFDEDTGERVNTNMYADGKVPVFSRYFNAPGLYYTRQQLAEMESKTACAVVTDNLYQVMLLDLVKALARSEKLKILPSSEMTEVPVGWFNM